MTLGNKWSCDRNETTLRQSGSDVTLSVDAATSIKFTGSGSPVVYSEPTGTYLELKAVTADKVFILTDKVNSLRYKFNEFTVTTVAHRGKLVEESRLEWFTQGKSGSTYTYDSNGNLTEIWPPAGNRTTMSYDKENRLIVHKEGATVNTMTYDGDGLKRAEIAASGRTILARNWSRTNVYRLIEQRGVK